MYNDGNCTRAGPSRPRNTWNYFMSGGGNIRGEGVGGNGEGQGGNCDPGGQDV